MERCLKNNRGITLFILVITIVVMLILAGVSISLLTNEKGSKNDLENHANVMNEFYNTSNEIIGSIKNELNVDYNTISQNTTISNDVPLVNNKSKWNGSVNTPNLLDGMTAIYFDGSIEKTLTSSSSQEEWERWYDYSEQKWANAKTDDGSYWVWIPRFAYKITNNLGTNTVGNISVIFINNINQNSGITYSYKYPENPGNSMADYVVHPAFATNIENGGNERNISGFWVAKYEMSMEKSENGGTTWNYAAGVDTLTKNAGNTTSIRAVSKPEVPSWRNITIGKAYTNSYYYNRNADSHMMKNSEWGAVAYLAQSAYGRNGIEVSQNTSSIYVTGTGKALASTTGNEFGVFDMNGGAFEMVSAYISNTESQVLKNEYASSFATLTQSNKYATVYPHNTTSDTSANNWNVYNANKTTRFGDAILEVSNSGTGNNAWYSDSCIYPSSTSSFMVRGGTYNYTSDSSGIFMFGRVNGNVSNECTFRTVLF